MLKWNAGKINVGTSPTQIVAARTGRVSLKLWNFSTTGSNRVYAKNDNSVAVTDLDTTALLTALVSNVWDLPTEQAVWGIMSSGTRDIWFQEIYEE